MDTDDAPEQHRMSRQAPALALAVGDVAIASAYLEQAVADLLSALMGNSRGANAITAGLNFDQLVQSCNAVLNQATHRPRIDEVKATLTEAQKAWRERSNVVHARWAMPSGDGRHYAFRERRWTPALASLSGTAHDIHEIADQLYLATRGVGARTVEHITGAGRSESTDPPSAG